MRAERRSSRLRQTLPYVSGALCMLDRPGGWHSNSLQGGSDGRWRPSEPRLHLLQTAWRRRVCFRLARPCSPSGLETLLPLVRRRPPASQSSIIVLRPASGPFSLKGIWEASTISSDHTGRRVGEDQLLALHTRAHQGRRSHHYKASGASGECATQAVDSWARDWSL